MEYTKDVILNLNHKDNIGIFKLRKRLTLINVYKFIQENKFITITLISVIVLVSIDIALVNAFMNLLITI